MLKNSEKEIMNTFINISLNGSVNKKKLRDWKLRTLLR